MATAASTPEKVRKPAGNRGQGRKAGVPNRVTTEFRETVQRLLDDNRDNVAKWLKQVAEGVPARYNKAGHCTHPGRPPDPAAALTRLGHLADFAAPKLSRQEQVGEGGGPLTVIVKKEA